MKVKKRVRKLTKLFKSISSSTNRIKYFVLANRLFTSVNKNYIKKRKTQKLVRVNSGKVHSFKSTNNPEKIHIIGTIKNQIKHTRKPFELPIEKKYWLEPIYKARPKMDIILILDASSSSKSFFSQVKPVLMTLFDRYLDSQCKLGLVTIEHSTAKAVFSPTKNRLRVFGKLDSIEIGGESPLPRAFELAINEAKRIKKNPSEKPRIILLSDCSPEPVEPSKDPYESEIYAKSRILADKLRRMKIPVIIIDPLYASPRIREHLPCTRLARYIATKTNGIHINVAQDYVSNLHHQPYGTLSGNTYESKVNKKFKDLAYMPDFLNVLFQGAGTS